MPEDVKQTTRPPEELAAFRYASAPERTPLAPLNLAGLRGQDGRQRLSDRLLQGLRFAVRLDAPPSPPPEAPTEGMGVLRYHVPLEAYRATRRRSRDLSRRLAVGGAIALAVPLVIFGVYQGTHRAPTPVRPAAVVPVTQAPVTQALVTQAPVAQAPVAQAPAAPAAPILKHVIAEGDTLLGIAHRYHVKARALRLANDLPRDAKLKIGRELVIPAPAITTAAGLAAHEASGMVVAPPPPVAKPEERTTPKVAREVPKRRKRVKYTIQEGDTLSTIAARYGVKTMAIVEINDVERTSTLRVGRKLLIPPNVDVPGETDRSDRRERRKLASRGLLGDIGRAITKGFVWPTAGRVSSAFGYRGERHFHAGLDIPNSYGAPIHATRPGKVVNVGWEGAYGKTVDISHGNGVVTRYAHCSKILVREGERVSQGETIARVGATGRATGPHLHYEVRVNGRPVNPKKFM